MVRLDLEGLVQKIPDREPLEHQHGALLVGDVVGQLDQLLPGDIALAGIGAEIVVVGDAVARMEIRDARPDRDDLARGLVAGDERQLRRLVEAGAINRTSMKFSPTACWRMRTSPGPGAGTSTLS
ncbi:hypothetical protein BRDID11002_43630 [Bradyrhizobium diazoefficiens]